MIGNIPNPTQSPAFKKADGNEKIPVPMFPFSKWAIVSKFLNIFKLTKEQKSR